MTAIDVMTKSVAPVEPVEPARRSRRRPLGPIGFWLAMAWIVLLVAGAVLADLLPLPDPNESDYDALELTPGWSHHPLGTDQLGRDTLARVLFGARVSLLVALVAVGVALVVGGAIGVLAGYLRGRVEAVVLVVCDAVLAFPNIVMIIVIVTIFGARATSLTIGLCAVFLPTFLRLARSATLAVVPQDYVLAARATGASGPWIVRRDVVPNIMWSLLTYAVIAISTAIVAEGSLSFLGLGLRPPNSSWGAMIAGGMDSLETAPHVSLTPAVVMCITVLSFNVVGEDWRRRSGLERVR